MARGASIGVEQSDRIVRAVLEGIRGLGVLRKVPADLRLFV